MNLTQFDTKDGPCFLDLSEVITVSSPFVKGRQPPARAVFLRGGHRVYVLDSRANVERLLGPDLAEALSAASIKLAEVSQGPVLSAKRRGRPKKGDPS